MILYSQKTRNCGNFLSNLVGLSCKNIYKTFTRLSIPRIIGEPCPWIVDGSTKAYGELGWHSFSLYFVPTKNVSFLVGELVRGGMGRKGTFRLTSLFLYIFSRFDLSLNIRNNNCKIPMKIDRLSNLDFYFDMKSAFRGDFWILITLID